MDTCDYILAKHEGVGRIPLVTHLEQVVNIAMKIASELGFDVELARKGAILHDIGKASILFQLTLKHGYIRPPHFKFRHEIASLFFLSLIDDAEWPFIIDMIIAHHKSLYGDVGKRGLLDLEEWEEDNFALHIQGFEIWSKDALAILSHFNFPVHDISLVEAKENYDKVVAYCEKRELGCSEWKGLLMAADHLASDLEYRSENVLEKLFIVPDLSFYNRKDVLYPLSLIGTDDKRKHTIVTAPTGAGKTDFLLRRCQKRVFYTLPFQASINAMYERVKDDLKGKDLSVCVQHAASCVKMKEGTLQEKIIQRHLGASVKILTPHQMAGIIFGIKGYEAVVLDLKGCDVILDEIHTYNNLIQAMVLKIIEILVMLDCRVHVGTATMPTALYRKILNVLGGSQQVYEVSLPEKVLDSFNRHTIYKKNSFGELKNEFENAIAHKQKVLIVCNQVKRAQRVYKILKEKYPEVAKMLIHSRFERTRRNELESILRNEMNKNSEGCIVVSTQVVEVSLDISFDMLITECAPLDALIQRFGRVNRIRTLEGVGSYKPIYVIKPPEGKNDALPYDVDILRKSYLVLPECGLLEEKNIQILLDMVYPEIDYKFWDINMNVVFRDGMWKILKLKHYPKSVLLDLLDINSIVGIREAKQDEYKSGDWVTRSEIEIPISYKSIKNYNLSQMKEGMSPFLIPEKAYSNELGLLLEYIKPTYYCDN